MDEILAAWIAKVTGGKVVPRGRPPTGASRATWLVDVEMPSGDVRELVLRHDTGDGPLSGSEFTMGREARLLKALHTAGLRVPEVVAVSGTGDDILMQRVVGTSDHVSLDAAEREEILLDFFAELARLHSLDIDQLDLGFRRPADPSQNALPDLDAWEGHFNTFKRRDAPTALVRWALGWLRRNAPATGERTSVCHGDAGPGNFMHHAGKVSALLDWEFAHFGDPLDDLAGC